MPKPPCFFFSYARADCGKWLKTFFKELKERVAQRGRLRDDDGEVSFRDIDDVELGKDWEREISDALSKALTMISIYSPNYFSRPYCGKEFRVFLNRQAVNYDDEGAARNSEKIIPVLWEKKADLDRYKLPPAVAKFIQFNFTQHHAEYLQRGLRYIRIQEGYRGKYVDLLEELVDILLQRSEDQPLLAMPTPPAFAEIDDIFANVSATETVSDLDSESMLLVYLTAQGPGYVAPRPDRYGKHPREWRPFQGDREAGIHVYVKKAVANLGFTHFIEPAYDINDARVATEIGADLVEATLRNAIAVVFLDPLLLGAAQGRRVCEALLMYESWRGALFILRDAGDVETGSLQPLVKELTARLDPKQERILISVVEGTIEDFESAFLTQVTELQMRIANDGAVPQPLTGPSRSTLPALQGPAVRQSHGC
jgi:hypothetical protein